MAQSEVVKAVAWAIAWSRYKRAHPHRLGDPTACHTISVEPADLDDAQAAAYAARPAHFAEAAGIAEGRSDEWKTCIADGLRMVSCNRSYANGAQTEAELLAHNIRAAGEAPHG